MRGQGLDKDTKEACVEVPINLEKKGKQGPEEQLALIDIALSR